jgi:hypothetical protein
MDEVDRAAAEAEELLDEDEEFDEDDEFEELEDEGVDALADLIEDNSRR